MSITVVVGGFIGKALAGSLAKGAASKATGAAAKGLFGHHAHHGVAAKVAQKAADEVTDRCIDRALEGRKEPVRR